MKKLFRTFLGIFIAAAILAGSGCKTESDDSDTSAPSEVSGLEIKAADGNAILTWKNPDDQDFAGVKISASPAKGTLANAVILEKPAESFSVSGLEAGSTYTFKVQTFDTDRNYSEGTQKEVTVESTEDTVPPGKVQELKAEAKDGGVRITWKDPSDEDLFEIEIAYTSLEENTSGGTQESGENQTAEKPKRCSIAPKGAESAYVTGLTNGTKYIFTVTAVDLSGNRSESQSQEAQPEPSQTGVPMTISLEKSDLTLNDDGTQTMTVTATIKSESNIKKVKYTRYRADVDEVSDVLDDNNIYWSDGEQRIFELKKYDGDNSKYTFTITADPKKYANKADETYYKEEYLGHLADLAERDANGPYTVVAIDDMGRQTAASIEVNEFDFTPPEDFYVKFEYKDSKITLSAFSYLEYNNDRRIWDNKLLKKVDVSYKKKDSPGIIKTQTFNPKDKINGVSYAEDVVFTTDTLEKDKDYVFTVTAEDSVGHQQTKTLERKASKYNLGDYILKDGTTMCFMNEKGVYTNGYNRIKDENNPKIAQVAFINESGEAFAIANIDSNTKIWGEETTEYYGLDKYTHNIPNIQCTPSKTSASIDETEKITFTGDTDGSDNWEEICKVDTKGTQNAAENYPAFEYAKNIATYKPDFANFPDGWYIPSMEEYYKIFLNQKQTGIISLEGWTSNQSTDKTDEIWCASFGNVGISFTTEKAYSEYSAWVQLIRKFTEE